MKEKISKFSPGLFIIILGIVVLVFGITSEQNGVFLTAGISIVIAGLITLFNALGKISNKVGIIVAVVLLVLSGYLSFANFNSIDEPIRFNKEKHIRYEAVIQNLKDLREIELAYKKQNKVFCADMDTLMVFISSDTVDMMIMEGDVPDTLTEQQAIEMGIIIRETVKVPAFEYTFNETYMKTRDSKYPLGDLNQLRFVPLSDNVEFLVEAGEITRSSGAKVQVFLITDAAPFDPNDVMKVGSMIDPSTAGNWKEEK